MKCIIIAAGPELDGAALLKEASAGHPLIICADAGYGAAIAAGLRPHITVGDFDSLKGGADGAAHSGELITLPAEKDVTDTFAAAEVGLSRGCDEFSLHGCTGGRLDHELGNLGVMLHLHKMGAKTRLFAPWGEAQVISESYRLDCRPGDTFSLCALWGTARGVTLSGAKYPLKDATLPPYTTLGISNVALGDNVLIQIKNGDLLLLLPKEP